MAKFFKMRPLRIIPIFSILFLITILSSQCTTPESSTSVQKKPEQSIEQLSKNKCGTCHLYPSPDLLDKTTWKKYVLPRMGYFMGVYSDSVSRLSLIEENFGGTIVERQNVFPKEPTISNEDWQAIQDFYLSNAPENLEVPVDNPNNTLTKFKTIIPEYLLSPPSSTFVGFSKNKNLFLGDANKRSLMIFNDKLQLTNRANLQEGIVQVTETSSGFFVTTMGSFSPTDNPLGKIFSLPKNGTLSILIDSLQRPVQSQFTDLNQDGLMDIVVAEFGKWTGGISYFQNENNQRFIKKKIRNQAGAINIYVHDFNEDGRSDILGLFGQGDEGIYIFENIGDGNFKSHQVLRFPASYGSSYCNLYDFNQDGKMDIIYTAGDNADYAPLMKPYHGIRIFENQGNYQFKETFFHHLNGAYKAVPFDFDADGDIDIAAISFFPDYKKESKRGFVLLENQGDFKMKSYTFDQVNLGRWLTMDVGDFEGDGDQDIVLGSLVLEVPEHPTLINQWVQNGIPFVLLENRSK